MQGMGFVVSISTQPIWSDISIFYIWEQTEYVGCLCNIYNNKKTMLGFFLKIGQVWYSYVVVKHMYSDAIQLILLA